MSLLKAVAQVLQLFAEGEQQVGVATLGLRLGFPKSNASRVLVQMAEHGLLERDVQDRKYRLGTLVVKLGQAHQRSRPPVQLQAHEALAGLSARSGHTAHLSVLDGMHSVLLEHFAGPNPLQVISPVGSRLPASVTAMGRALLSRLSEADFRERYGSDDDAALPSSPPRCPQTVGVLAMLVQQARRERSAVAVDEGLSGVAAVATTLYEPTSRTALGMALSFPSQLVSASDIRRYREELMKLACQLGEGVGDPWWVGQAPTPADLGAKAIARPDDKRLPAATVRSGSSRLRAPDGTRKVHGKDPA
jgi:DNA-binding IclR family transcriptional regulator